MGGSIIQFIENKELLKDFLVMDGHLLLQLVRYLKTEDAKELLRCLIMNHHRLWFSGTLSQKRRE